MATESPRASALSTLGRRAREALLLGDSLRRAIATPAERRQAIRAYYDAALDRTAVADQLTDERGAVSALLLYREALPLLVAAIALRHDPEHPLAESSLPTAVSAWDVLVELRQRGQLPPLPRTLDRARAALTATGPLELDRLPPQKRLDRRAVVQTTMRRLRALVQPRTPEQLRGSRNLRVASAVALLALLAFGVIATVRHPNLALHKPVTASSRHPSSTAPPDSRGLTNGVIEPTYGIETAPGAGWVMIDLQDEHRLSKVKVFNRRDALFDAGLPLTLETSLDGVTFTVAQVRTLPFSASSPWTYTPIGETRARYVRIRSNSLVALTEVEVY